VCARAVEDTQLDALVVAVVAESCAINLPQPLENRLHRCRDRRGASAPWVPAVFEVRNLALRSGQPPSQLLHIRSIVEKLLERPPLLDAGTLNVGQALQAASEQKL
jgi:hypothetical protein